MHLFIQLPQMTATVYLEGAPFVQERKYWQQIFHLPTSGFVCLYYVLTLLMNWVQEGRLTLFAMLEKSTSSANNQSKE